MKDIQDMGVEIENHAVASCEMFKPYQADLHFLTL